MRDPHFLQLPALRHFSAILLLIVVIGASAYAGGAPSAQASDQPVGIVTGWVRDARTQQGIAGATVTIGAVRIVSDAQGNLPQTGVPLNGSTEVVDVVAAAPGYATWRYDGVELSPTRPVELRIRLGDQPLLAQPKPVSSAAIPFDGPPDYINVGRTFSTDCVYPPSNVQRVDRMPFFDYVRNVLPNEWIGSWPAAALDAGAVAAEQYAWTTAFVQRKWTKYGYAFDVLDNTCDQVYKDRSPTKSYAATDAAVARMWGTALMRYGSSTPFITTYFRAYDEQCPTNADCMGQWGSYARANEGLSGLDILHYYYDRSGTVTNLQTAPVYRALVVARSPNVTMQPGQTTTLRLCLRNAGTQPWQQGVTQLGTVDPNDPQQTDYSSPFASAAWLSPTRPATIERSSASLGVNGSWSFGITAPTSLAPGTYQFAVQPVQGSTPWITTDKAIVWNVTVSVPPPPSMNLPKQVWLPMITTGTSTAFACP